MIHHGDCLDVMAAMEPESVDAIVTDPPYGLEFMGKEWDRLAVGPNVGRWSGRRTAAEAPERDPATPGGRHAASVAPSRPNPKCATCGHYRFSGTPCRCDNPVWIARPNEQAIRMGRWHQQWAEAAYRVAKPSAYLLAFGGTRTVHRLTVALEDAGWIIRDMLVWGYASGFPKSKASLKPAWEPIVMARKPGPLRELAIDACRIPSDGEPVIVRATEQPADLGTLSQGPRPVGEIASASPLGRWPANIVLTDPIFDGGIEGVVGGGETARDTVHRRVLAGSQIGNGTTHGEFTSNRDSIGGFGDTGTYSRFFLLPKADRVDREPVIRSARGNEFASGVSSGSMGAEPPNRSRTNSHPTVKPTDLMRHLVRLVTPAGGTVLDPFLGSGTTGLACELEGFPWIGIEREAEYVAIAEARLNGTQRGLGLAG